MAAELVAGAGRVAKAWIHQEIHRGYHYATSQKTTTALAPPIAPPIITNQAEWLVCITQWGNRVLTDNKPIKVHAFSDPPRPFNKFCHQLTVINRKYKNMRIIKSLKQYR